MRPTTGANLYLARTTSILLQDFHMTDVCTCRAVSCFCVPELTV
jgi:hypothetical protein